MAAQEEVNQLYERMQLEILPGPDVAAHGLGAEKGLVERMVDHIGRQLGNYRLVRLIGRGGFADVYLGEHVYLHTQVAVKLLQARVADDELEGFLKEARTIAHLVHPHIVRVMDFGVERESPFLVMDYAPNGTLAKHHPRGKQFLPLPSCPVRRAQMTCSTRTMKSSSTVTSSREYVAGTARRDLAQ